MDVEPLGKAESDCEAKFGLLPVVVDSDNPANRDTGIGVFVVRRDAAAWADSPLFAKERGSLSNFPVSSFGSSLMMDLLEATEFTSGD